MKGKTNVLSHIFLTKRLGKRTKLKNNAKWKISHNLFITCHLIIQLHKIRQCRKQHNTSF